MPIRAVLFDLGNTLVSYYQPPDFMPILRRSLQAWPGDTGPRPSGPRSTNNPRAPGTGNEPGTRRPCGVAARGKAACVVQSLHA